MASNHLGRPTNVVRIIRVYHFIHAYLTKRGFPPTLQEIGDHLGVDRSMAHYYVHTMRKAGIIRRIPHKARAMKLVRAPCYSDFVKPKGA